MKTIPRSRSGGIASSLLVLIASFCMASMTYAAPRPSMKELLASQQLDRLKTPFPLSVRIAYVDVSKTAGGKGDLDDRWHSSDAFRSSYSQEFYDGLVYYLKARGFKVSPSKGDLVARVYIDGFTGRKGSGEYGGDLKGTLTLRLNGKEMGLQPLSESVNYRDDTEERRAFAREFSLEKVSFSTVLFYNLTVAFYDSIATGILDANPDADVAIASAPIREAAPLVHASAPPPAPEKVPPPLPLPKAPQPQARPEPARIGILTIESTPDAAEIYLDSNLVATTPARKLRLPAGDHLITIKKEGYADWVRDIRVLDDADVTLKATLQKSEPEILNQEKLEEEKLDQ